VLPRLETLLPMAKKHTLGLDGRHRDKSGRIEKKHGNTRVSSLRKEYGESFAKGHRGDAKLSTVLASTGTRSLKEYILHSKRGDTLVSTLRDTYGHGFVKGRRSDAKLNTARKNAGMDISNTVFSRTTKIFEPALKNLAKK
jgi:hypothetical protein